DRTIVSIGDPGKMQLVYTAFNTDNIRDVIKGMTVNVDFNKQIYTGTVVQTPLDAPETTNTELRLLYSKSIYIDMEPLPQDVKEGDHANIEIITASKENALIIPKEGLREHFGRSYVQVLVD